MVTKINSANLRGIDAVCVSVETDVTKGMPVFNIVGSADSAVRESKERIRAAISNSGLEYPLGRITINIAPADIRKRGSLLDLPMAMGMLASTGQVRTEELAGYALIGELSLDGKVNPVTGVLPMVQRLKGENIGKVIVPGDNVREASLVRGIEVYGADDLKEVTDHFNGEAWLEPAPEYDIPADMEDICPDFRDVSGQEEVKRALTIAVSGGHGILMRGSPSTGKTMMAERIPGIMPRMTYEETMEITGIYSAAGLLSREEPYVFRRPFRRPHHKVTSAAMIGGGNHPMPGEITLAHRGSLITAEYAVEQSRALYAVPANINSKASFGSNDLLRAGAIPLVRYDDLITDMGIDPAEVLPGEEDMSSDERNIYDMISSGGEMTTDQICNRTLLDPSTVKGIITVLEMKGLVVSSMGRVFVNNISIDSKYQL